VGSVIFKLIDIVNILRSFVSLTQRHLFRYYFLWCCYFSDAAMAEAASKRNIMPAQRKLALLLCTGLAVAGCGQRSEPRAAAPVRQQPATKPAPPTPIAEKKEELHQPSWDPQWDLIVEKSLSPAMLSPAVARGVKSFCPRFASLSEADKRAFWAYTFQALAGAEAGLTPTTNVQHTEPEVAKVDTVSKRMIRSEGLLQLTYMDADRYGCDFDWDHDKTLPEKDPAKTILQPANNLLCGVKIMENQIVARRKPLLSASSYWVTLQPTHPSYKVFAKQMANVPSVCRAAPLQQARQHSPSSTAAAAALVPARSGTP
jgi:hypothetical protein